MKRLCLAILLLVAMSSYAYAATCKVIVREIVNYYSTDPETGRILHHHWNTDTPSTYEKTVTTYDIAGDVSVEISHVTEYEYLDGDLKLIRTWVRYEDTSPFMIIEEDFYYYENGVMYDSEHYYDAYNPRDR